MVLNIFIGIVYLDDDRPTGLRHDPAVTNKISGSSVQSIPTAIGPSQPLALATLVFCLSGGGVNRFGLRSDLAFVGIF